MENKGQEKHLYRDHYLVDPTPYDFKVHTFELGIWGHLNGILPEYERPKNWEDYLQFFTIKSVDNRDIGLDGYLIKGCISFNDNLEGISVSPEWWEGLKDALEKSVEDFEREVETSLPRI